MNLNIIISKNICMNSVNNAWNVSLDSRKIHQLELLGCGYLGCYGLQGWLGMTLRSPRELIKCLWSTENYWKAMFDYSLVLGNL